MIVAPLPHNESERLVALRSYAIMDTQPEQAYDDFTLLASQICGTPIALIGLIDETRQWYKARVGIDAREVAREMSFCSHALVQTPPGLMEIPDAREDIRFQDNPAVTSGDSPVRFYAGAPLVAPGEHVLGTLCVIDSSPRHLSENQRKALEALARQVSAQLELRAAKAKLDAQNAELRTLNAQKNQFIGMAVHDLRNPLQVIDGYGKLLSNKIVGDVNPVQAQALEAITKNCGFMLGLVTDLLSLSTLEAGELQLDFRRADIGAIAEKNVTLNRLMAEAKGIALAFSCDSGMPQVLADAFRIEQVLNNLVSNAIKFSHAKTTVTVRVENAQEAGKTGVRLSVQDEGQGIPPAELKKLFQPFAKTSVRSTAGEASTGLGLFIVKRLVEAHGGIMSVESKVGEGSAFRVFLPA
jgi:signal transduction histidine kinase